MTCSKHGISFEGPFCPACMDDKAQRAVSAVLDMGTDAPQEAKASARYLVALLDSNKEPQSQSSTESV